jgi:hypothetical protein
MTTPTHQHAMRFTQKVCLAYTTIFSSLVGAAWMGNQLAHMLIPKHHYSEAHTQTIMVSGRD